ncbi:Acetylcholine receptor-like protein cup-4 [Caenorhabditis elegans]|uniref:Acetylcholine receptor-like protein cup-4 n=1 Tax=Caenorhabditis elegans TaxID=6239 RepID=Q9XTY8_CAEEL|nr:Neurotransmitter-gated ion-channel ligand-binding domain-containing protein [Caenorhabditis elegans]CAB07402.3 Neurotransmitter-gated ion-channel ligand-binding domain-containing protein [Caenorhabditis elegans]|eukprot:NP_510359.3 Ligand-Gated ion Channel [Caenorhabditis elegans]
MTLTQLLLIGILVIWHLDNQVCGLSKEQQLEKQLMVKYNYKVRPVKSEATVTQVNVFLSIAHVEKVDEHEQTALVHGHIWATWIDEYMQWDAKKENVTKLTISAHSLWQPALALYNSARGNSWHLYMGAMPATVYSTGKVWSTGTFSFYVTCQFDFTNWPFDQQSCPIVIADWVYNLNQVNLSDPYILKEYGKPSIRLSYDPIEKSDKRHVAGWEVMDAWKKHCYWGPKGCKEEQPEGEAEWYWSLLEFGIILRRHLPYFSLSILFPMAGTSLILLLCFWIETHSICFFTIMLNIILQSYYGSSLLAKMPPGSGRTPKIVHLYNMNLLLSAVQFVLIVFSEFLRLRLPKKFELDLGFDIIGVPQRFGVDKLFTQKGLSFDPQELFSNVYSTRTLEEILEQGGGSSSTSVGIGNPLHEDITSFQKSSDSSVLIDIPMTSEPQSFSASTSELLSSEPSSNEETQISEEPEEERILDVQLRHIKRYVFCLVIFIHIIAFLLVLFT